MKITFLGTADGIPRKGHFCTSTMIELGERIYLFDAGAPVNDLLLRHDLHQDNLKAFFNTHPHTDHLDGLLQLVTLCTWARPNAAFDLYMTEQDVIDAFVGYVEKVRHIIFPHDRLRMKLYSAGPVYDDGYIKVTAIPTRHIEPFRPSFAFIVEAEGKKVVLSGDLSFGFARNDFPEEALGEDVDLFVCEMAHFGEEHLLPYMERCKAKRVIFNHYQERKLADIASLATPGRFPFPISAANDDDTVEL